MRKEGSYDRSEIFTQLVISFKRARSPSIFCTVYFLDFTQLGIVWPVAYFVAELFTLTVLPSAIEPEAAAVEAPAMSEAFTQP